jgi:hypothetical protein
MAFEILGVLGLLLNRRSGLSVRNGVLLYKQLVRPMMDLGIPFFADHIRALTESFDSK